MTIKNFFTLILLTISLAGYCKTNPKTVNVSDFGLKPGTNENAIKSVINAIEECKKHPISILRFETGRYDFWPDSTHVKDYFESNTTDNNPKKLAILIENCKGLTVEGNGAEFVFHGAMQPVTVDNSSAITVRNLSIDWDIPLTAQGKVLATSAKNIDLEIDTVQFPYQVSNGKLIFRGENWKAESRSFMEYEAGTHRIAAETGDAGCVRGDMKKFSVEALNPGIIRLNGEFTRTPAKGNFLILRHSPRDHAGIFIQESSDVTLENVNIYHCAGLGVLSQFSKNLTYKNVKFIPNAAKNRYLSGHDDGFQVSNCAGMVSIDRCEFGGLMDDPINVHGTSVKIIEKQSDKKLKCRFMHDQSTGMVWGHVGDVTGFIENKSMQTIGKGFVKSFTKLSRDEFIVEFDSAIPAGIETGDALENLTWSPSVTIKNSKFGSCRARGLLVSTPGKVLIENNEFESSGSAILIAGDANGWYESGAVSNVTIRNNVFKDACMTSMYQFCEAIISIYPIIPEAGPQKPFHRNITIEKNTFHAFDYPVLYALSVDGLKFNHNKIIRSNAYKPFHYRKHAFTFDACFNVEIKGNRFEGDVLSKEIRLIKTAKEVVKTDLPAKDIKIEPRGPGVAGNLPSASRASFEDHKTRPFILADSSYYTWGGTPIQGDDGLYHIFYDRWPRKNPRGMFGWLYITEIAHATSEKPEGPYTFRNIALNSAGDNPSGRWDAVNTHNACVTRFPDPETGKLRYYLYFIANRGKNTMSDPWLVHIGNQRIGVAWSDSPDGPWIRYSEPVCNPGGPLQHYVVNPGVTRLPDGRYLMVLKGRASVEGKPDAWGPMLHGWALADKPTGPFKIQPTLLFPGEISAEDPCVWVQDGRVFAAVKDWNGKLSKVAPGISWVYGDIQPNGSIKWEIPENPLISARNLKWDDGTETKINTLERPYILLDLNGRPKFLFAACCLKSEYTGSSQIPVENPPQINPENLPVNVCIPLFGTENQK